MSDVWRKCSVCKKDIPFGGIYHVCSISSCRKSVFCSDSCWDVHNGVINHKSAWAEEKTAPASEGDDPRRLMARSDSGAKTIASSNENVPTDILVVASKLKNYVKAKHGMNTSSNVMDALSQIMRVIVDNAVDRARAEGRKTLMDRDFLNEDL